jgi:hypothetical protein
MVIPTNHEGKDMTTKLKGAAKQKAERLHVWLRRDLHARLKTRAEQRGQTLQRAIDEAVTRDLRRT